MPKSNKKSVAKAPKVVKEKKEKNVVLAEAKLQFVAFRVRAVIPTMAYGNIQPEIEVTAPTYEEARDFAMPLIEGLFAKYSETKPTFLGKVTEEVKQVAPVTAPKAPEVAPKEAEVTAKAPEVASKPKSEPVLKAEKAISLAMTEEAALIIQEQIVKSVKIAEEDKDALLSLVLKKRGEIAKKK